MANQQSPIYIYRDSDNPQYIGKCVLVQVCVQLVQRYKLNMYSLYHILLYFPLAAMVAISIVILDVVILFDSSDQNTYIEKFK